VVVVEAEGGEAPEGEEATEGGEATGGGDATDGGEATEGEEATEGGEATGGLKGTKALDIGLEARGRLEGPESSSMSSSGARGRRSPMGGTGCALGGDLVPEDSWDEEGRSGRAATGRRSLGIVRTLQRASSAPAARRPERQ